MSDEVRLPFANVNIAVSLEKVVKSFGSGDGVVRAVDGITLQVQRGEFFSLLGPSGCGKTTLLRLIAGFETLDSGKICVEGKEMSGVPPQQRPVNTVFQSYALFPHMNVFDNVAFGLRMKKLSRAEIDQRVERVMNLTHIAELRTRLPEQLSGGQKQRVALARAVVNEPAVLLLDEPLAAIDAKLRGQLQSDLRALQRELGTTFVYVTHDQDEALSLSDRVAVLNRGKVLQTGTPHEVYERPRSSYVASFLGACNVFAGEMTGTREMRCAFGVFRVDGDNVDAKMCGIRREDVQLFSDVAQRRENSVFGEIADVSYTGAQVEYTVQIGSESLRALFASDRGGEFARGAKVQVQLPLGAILLFEND